MSQEETNILKKIQIATCAVGARLFRNNTGLFRTIDGKRKVYVGLERGGSDLIGWTPIIVTQEMVGKKIAIFTAVEVKTSSGKSTSKQRNFVDQVIASGGYAGFATDEMGAIKIIQN